MGGDDAVDTATDRDAPDASTPTGAGNPTDAGTPTDASNPTDAGSPSTTGDATGRTDGSTDATGPTGGADDRATLRVTEDVGEIFGVDEREYTLSSEDVVTLPEENATALVAQGAAERLD
jgi:DNA replication factor GINS